MTEYQRIGSRYAVHRVHATTFPEMQLIADLIQNEGQRWILVTAEQYSEFTEWCEAELKGIA